MAKPVVKYLGNSFARTQMPYDVQSIPLRVRLTKTKSGHDWTIFYNGRKKVWSCNRHFFNTHFFKVKEL